MGVGVLNKNITDGKRFFMQLMLPNNLKSQSDILGKIYLLQKPVSDLILTKMADSSQLCSPAPMTAPANDFVSALLPVWPNSFLVTW